MQNPENPKPEEGQEVHAAAAERHGDEARAKAAEAGSAAGESASEATQAAKERLAQAGDATKSAAERTTAAAKETGAAAADRAGAAAEATKEASAADTERAGAGAAAAKDKLTEAGESVQGGVAAAIGFIKEHLPKVEHSEDTPEELCAKALLDEAMGRPAEGPEGTPSEPAGPGGTAAVVAPEKDVAQPSDVEVRVLKDTRSKARQIVDSMGRTADSALGAPFELRSAAAEEEHAKEALRSGRGLTEALEEKVESAKAALKEHMPHFGGEGSSSPGTTASEVAADARRRAEEATRAAGDKSSGATHTVEDTLSKAYHKVADPISGAVHSAEDKARWAYEHTKEELLHKSAAETHAEMAPHTPYDAKLAHGEVPSSTQEILGGAPAPGTPVKAGGGGTGTAGDATTEQALAKSAEGYGTKNLGPTDTRDLAHDVVSAPAPGTFTEAPPGPVSADAPAAGGSWGQRHGLTRTALRETFREGIHDIDNVKPGSEGEIPS